MSSVINVSCETNCDEGLERLIDQCIQKALEAEHVGLDCEINVLITDDPGIKTINRDFREKDEATDVLSFPMFDLIAGQPPDSGQVDIDPETRLLPLGDIAISFERAESQALEFGHSVEREIGYLTVHSVLHLLGYDHMEEEDRAVMRRREEEIMEQLTLKR